jgi:hypothetical protein
MKISLSPEQMEEVIANVHKYHPAHYAIYRVIEGKSIDSEIVAEETGVSPSGVYFYKKSKNSDRKPIEKVMRLVFAWAGANPVDIIRIDYVDFPDFGIINSFEKVSGVMQSPDCVRYEPQKKIPLTINTGYGKAVLAKTGQIEGFGDAPGVDFERGLVNGWGRDREYYESLGFTFFHAGEASWPDENSWQDKNMD